MIRKILLFVLISIISVSAVIAVPPGGANATMGETSSASETASTQASVESGNVTSASVYSQQITANWGGFYGNVSGGIVLGDASQNLFYSWTVSNFDGAVVYATSGAISDWGAANIAPANVSVVPAYINGSGNDHFASTFLASEDFNSSSIDEANVPYALTWQSGAQGTLKTYALYGINEGETIWAGLVDDDSASFRGAGYTIDYQIIVPAQALTTYSFYLELP